MQGVNMLKNHLAVFAFTFAAILFAPLYASLLAQQGSPSEEAKWHLGCELFQMLLEERGVTNIQSLESSFGDPAKSVIVLTDDLGSFRRDFWARLVQFAEKGGSVLIASDQSCLLSGIGEIKQGPVVSSRSEDLYLDHKDCLRIQRLDSEHPIMMGVNQIISNRTAWLALPNATSVRNPTRWKTVASLPLSSFPIASRGEPLIAVSDLSTPTAGVMVLVADTSIVTNGMLWHGDNAAFAIRLSETLCMRSKTNLTFVSGGRVLSSYKDRLQTPKPKLSSNEQTVPRVPELPSSDLETLLQVANHVLKSVEDSNVLNEALSNQPRPVNPRGYAMAVLAILAAVGVLVLLAVVVQRVPALLSRQPIVPHLSVFQLESNMKNRHSQYGPAAFILAREFCKECSGTSGEKEWRNKATRFHPSGAIPTDKAFQEKLEYVRSFEISNLVPRVSEKEFLKLGKTIQELRDALQSPKMDGAK